MSMSQGKASSAEGLHYCCMGKKYLQMCTPCTASTGM